jgi:hypothetical protein
MFLLSWDVTKDYLFGGATSQGILLYPKDVLPSAYVTYRTSTCFNR